MEISTWPGGNDERLDADDLIQQIGWFEAANGFPHGVLEILGGVLMALVLRAIRQTLSRRAERTGRSRVNGVSSG